MWTFPENLLKVDGSRAYPTWAGGLLGVSGKQVEDFNDFHRQWWLQDFTHSSSVRADSAQSTTVPVMSAAAVTQSDHPGAASASPHEMPPRSEPGSELPMQVPEWLRSFPSAIGQATHAVSSHAVDLSYNAPASPEAVSVHYQEQLRAAGVTFRTGFDGIGTSVRATDSKQSCVVRIVEVAVGVNVKATCAKDEPSKSASQPPRSVTDTSGLRPAQATPPRSGPPPSGWQIVSIESRVTESNNVWSRYAWKLTMRNESEQPNVFHGTIEFQDRDGFIVDTSRADNLLVPARSEQVFTGFALIRAEVAGNVARTVAKVGRGQIAPSLDRHSLSHTLFGVPRSAERPTRRV